MLAETDGEETARLRNELEALITEFKTTIEFRVSMVQSMIVEI